MELIHTTNWIRGDGATRRSLVTVPCDLSYERTDQIYGLIEAFAVPFIHEQRNKLISIHMALRESHSSRFDVLIL
jgi:hypothetical protein